MPAARPSRAIPAGTWRKLWRASFGAVVVLGCSVYEPELLGDAGSTLAGGGGDGGTGGVTSAEGGSPNTAGFAGAAAHAGTAAVSAGAGGRDGGGGRAGGSMGGRAGTPGGAAARGGNDEVEAGGDGSSGESAGGEAGSAGDGACSTQPGCRCDSTELACETLVSTLLHRYTFDGVGTAVNDVKGDLDGELLGTGASLDGSGVLELAGGGSAVTDPTQYVALPSDCLAGLEAATIELWFAWDATGDAWQHLFDFGEPSDETTGTTLWFSPQAQNTETGTSRAAFAAAGFSTQTQLLGPALPAGEYHVALVIAGGDALSLYVDGAFAGAQALPTALSALSGLDCWLGRSHFDGDPYFGGTLRELRIYGAALDADALRFSHEAGEEPAFL